jgi:hypothetical protein
MIGIKAGLTTNEMLRSIKRRALVPDNQNTFTDQDFIELMNEEMMIGIVPSILQTKEEYFIYKQVAPIVSNKSNYPIPERALANKLREISFIDNINNPNQNEYELTQIAIDDRYTSLSGAGSSDFSGFRRFYVQGSDIILHPAVGSTVYGGLAFYYYLRPNSLVKDSEVGRVSNINRETGVITFSELPCEFTKFAKGSNNELVRYDFIKAKSPHNILKIDLTIESINATAKTVTMNPAEIPLDLESGDFFAFAGQSCVPNIPTELHAILAHRVAQRVLEAIGDTEGLNNATNKLAEMESKLATMLDNRVEGAPRKVVNRSLMMGSARNRRR